MITGSYQYTPIDTTLAKYGQTLVIVKVNNTANYSISDVQIEGRPEISSEWYQEKQGNENQQVRHIISVYLIKKYLAQTYINQPLFKEPLKLSNKISEGVQDVQKKVDGLAKEIFSHYKSLVTIDKNLFIGDKEENLGSRELQRVIHFESLIKKGQKNFLPICQQFDETKEEDKYIIAFLKQVNYFKKLIQLNKQGITLTIKSWAELCFLYENTLIDYKNADCNKNQIKEGQLMVDRLYSTYGFDTSIRTRVNIQMDQFSISKFMVKRDNKKISIPSTVSPMTTSKLAELSSKKRLQLAHKPCTKKVKTEIDLFNLNSATIIKNIKKS